MQIKPELASLISFKMRNILFYCIIFLFRSPLTDRVLNRYFHALNQ